MIKFYDDTIVYIYAPAGVVTGGSELLFQLADLLNKNGKCAYIVYVGEKKHNIPEDYKQYNVLLQEKVDDLEHNIVVIYEGMFNLVKTISKSQILLWWLSVDLMFHSAAKFLSMKDIFIFSPKLFIRVLGIRIGRLLIKHKNDFKNNISLNDLKRINTLNAYQSIYAQNFLYNKGFSEVFSLSDYINTDFFDNKCNKKENIVLYNPKKGYAFTKKIIKSNQDIQFVPIVNLTRQGVINLLKKAKVYIDFGFHPGKDRIPREAALCGCVVITSKSGSAFYFEDIPISSDWKFETNYKNIPEISRKIKYVLDNYEEASKSMQYYCRKIQSEKEQFEREVKLLCNM